jgi:hypothetical protein
MQDKKKKTKTIKVPDLKPTKDAKGGMVANVNSQNTTNRNATSRNATNRNATNRNVIG